MTDYPIINNNLAVLKDTTMQMESTVLSVIHPNIGMQPVKDASLVNQAIPGTILHINALAVNSQDKSLVLNVSAHLQKHNGVKLLKHAHAHQIHLATTVFHVHRQDNGIHKPTLVDVLHLKLNGMEQHANVQLENTGLNVSIVPHQDNGIHKQINVFVINHLPGMETTAFARNLISFTKEDAQAAQMDTHGNKIDARDANVITKIYKFWQESETINDFYVIRVFLKYLKIQWTKFGFKFLTY